MKPTVHLYWSVVFVLFVGKGATYLAGIDRLPFNYAFTLQICLIPAFLYLAFRFLMHADYMPKLWLRYKSVLIPFFLLALLYLLLGFKTVSSIERGNSFSVYPVFCFTILLTAMAVGSTDWMVDHFKLYAAIALAALAGSTILNAVFPEIFHQASAVFHKAPAGLGMNRNYTASGLVMICAIVLNFHRFKSRDAGALLLVGLAVGLTLSRAGILSFLLLSFFYFHSIVRANRHKYRFLQKLTMTANVLAVLVVVLFLLFINHSQLFLEGDARSRIELLSSADVSRYMDPGRLELMDYSMKVIDEAPWLGHGPGYHKSHDFYILGPHNEFLRHAIDCGIVGALLFLAIIVNGAYRYYRQKNIQGVCFLVLVFGFCFFTHNLTEDMTFIFLYGFYCGVLNRLEERKRPVKRTAADYYLFRLRSENALPSRPENEPHPTTN